MIALVSAFMIAAVFLAIFLPAPAQTVDLYRPSHALRFEVRNKVAQSFVAPSNRLSSVGFYFLFEDNFPRAATAVMKITREDSGQLLRRVDRRVHRDLRIPVDIYRPTFFDFPPIEKSHGLRLQAEVYVEAPGVVAFGSATSSYSAGRAYLNGKPKNFDLSFVTRHAANYADRLTRMSRWSPTWATLLAVGSMVACGLFCAYAGALSEISRR